MPITIEQLTGYGERDLDSDLARWFPERPAVKLTTSIRPVAPFVARLPPDAGAALEGFDRRVRSGTLPRVLDVSDYSYGFEFAANDCEILDTDYETTLTDDDVWSVGSDGGGNLDVFLYSIVRYQAVRAGVVDRAAVEADFHALGQPGVLAPEVGLLAYLPK